MKAPPPTGSFAGIPQSQANGYKLTFGVVTPAITYADCKVVLEINGTMQTAQMIKVSAGNAFAANNISWTNLLNDEIVNAGDSLVVSDPVSSATYRVVIIWEPGGGMVCFQSWTVP